MKKLNIMLLVAMLVAIFAFYVEKAKKFLRTVKKFLESYEETFGNVVVIMLTALNDKLTSMADEAIVLYVTNSIFPEAAAGILKSGLYLGIGCLLFCGAIFVLRPEKGYGENNNYKDTFIISIFKFLITSVINAFLKGNINSCVVSIIVLWAYDFFKSFVKEEVKEKWNKAKGIETPEETKVTETTE